MVRPKIHDDALIDRLTEVFQTHGYEGASVSRLSKATGLERASLYHRFPGGKEEMAEVVLERAGKWLTDHVLAPLRQPGDPAARVSRMSERLGEYYGQGGRSCLLDVLSLGGQEGPFRERIRGGIATWLAAMASIAREAGCTEEQAVQRAEDAFIRIQGALVLARASGDRTTFQQVLGELPGLLAGEEIGVPRG